MIILCIPSYQLLHIYISILVRGLKAGCTVASVTAEFTIVLPAANLSANSLNCTLHCEPVDLLTDIALARLHAKGWTTPFGRQDLDDRILL